MDWDTFYFEWWQDFGPDREPTHEDYQEWLYDKADLALGKD